MNNGGLDAVQLGLISGVVLTIIKIVQSVNPGGIAPRTALIIAAGASFAGIAAWVLSQETLPDRTWTFGLLAAWAQTTAAALGGLVGVSALSPGGQVNAALRGTGSGSPPKY